MVLNISTFLSEIFMDVANKMFEITGVSSANCYFFDLTIYFFKLIC